MTKQQREEIRAALEASPFEPLVSVEQNDGTTTYTPADLIARLSEHHFDESTGLL